MYSGIKSDVLWLLARNKFENSKTFYDEHKEEIKQGITVPMRQIAEELLPLMYEIDEKMNLDPVRMVSRVRRDTRFSKNKNMYRDNLWMMFMRPKNDWNPQPAMWFEVTQEDFSYGVGLYLANPKFLEIYRQHLIKYPDEFVEAIKCARSVGARFSPGESYKKPKPGDPSPAVLPYYNLKSLYFIVERNDFKTLETRELIPQLEKAYSAYAPLYKFFLKIADEYTELIGGDTK